MSSLRHTLSSTGRHHPLNPAGCRGWGHATFTPGAPQVCSISTDACLALKTDGNFRIKFLLALVRQLSSGWKLKSQENIHRFQVNSEPSLPSDNSGFSTRGNFPFQFSFSPSRWLSPKGSPSPRPGKHLVVTVHQFERPAQTGFRLKLGSLLTQDVYSGRRTWARLEQEEAGARGTGKEADAAGSTRADVRFHCHRLQQASFVMCWGCAAKSVL